MFTSHHFSYVTLLFLSTTVSYLCISLPYLHHLCVQKFLLKKQELQNKKDREEKLLKEKAQKEKEEKLKELYQRQRNMAIAGSRNKQKSQQQFETQSLASSGVVLPSAEDMAFVQFEAQSLASSGVVLPSAEDMTSVSMCVYAYPCMHVDMCVHVYVPMYVCACECVCANIVSKDQVCEDAAWEK